MRLGLTRILIALMSMLPLSMEAQILAGANEQWNESSVNEIHNVAYSGQNPTRIAYNRAKNFGVAKLNYLMGRGAFRSVTTARKTDDVSVLIGGLKNIGKIDLAGSMKYSNRNEDHHRWNSTLFLDESNPFVLCDSVASDVTTESFGLNVIASYSLNEKWKGGISIDLQLGSSADQTDPRPKTNSSVLPITIGAEYAFSDQWRIGASVGARLYSSSISYSVINPLNSHTFFLMKGMGDYYKFSTSETSGYVRDYDGTSFSGAIQLRQGSDDADVQNFTEISFNGGNEKAQDGGSSYTFNGGDFEKLQYGLNHRLMWRTQGERLHHFNLGLRMTSSQGDWSDQRKKTDAEHGNLSYYVTLSKYQIEKDQQAQILLGYRFDQLRDGEQNFFAAFDGGLNFFKNQHFISGGNVEQKADVLFGRLSVGKSFVIQKAACSAILNGGYYIPQNKSYADGYSGTLSENISDSYTRAKYEYETAEHFTLGGKVNVMLPLKNNLRVGMYAQVSTSFYQDKEEFYRGFNNKNYTTTNIGAYLNF